MKNKIFSVQHLKLSEINQIPDIILEFNLK